MLEIHLALFGRTVIDLVLFPGVAEAAEEPEPMAFGFVAADTERAEPWPDPVFPELTDD